MLTIAIGDKGYDPEANRRYVVHNLGAETHVRLRKVYRTAWSIRASIANARWWGRLDAEACPRGRALDANACSAASWRCGRRTTLAERPRSFRRDDFYKAATGTVIIRLSAVVTWGGP